MIGVSYTVSNQADNLKLGTYIGCDALDAVCAHLQATTGELRTIIGATAREALESGDTALSMTCRRAQPHASDRMHGRRRTRSGRSWRGGGRNIPRLEWR